ncbi:MAG: DUF3141 domain-containing protein, partial [Holophagales bacterium]|nr:DUF3141 domain-containing protein [Holophagales bacterium]
FFESLLSTVGIGAWGSLHSHCQSLLSHPSAPVEDRKSLEADCRRIAFVRGYLGAYFREGHFIELQVRAPENESSIAGSVVEAVDRELSNVVKVSNVGFLSRDGSFRASLPTLEIEIDPTKKPFVSLDPSGLSRAVTPHTPGAGGGDGESSVGVGAELGAQIIRVYLEALFDAADGLPAVAAANLGGTSPTGLELGPYSLPLFRSPLGDVDAADLTAMTRFNNAVGFKTQVIVGRIISGLGPLNLDNPPIENAITEIVATTVRKIAEKASWCWYACDLDAATKRLAEDAKHAASDALHTEAKRIESSLGSARDPKDQQASKQVTMHLRIHP